MPVFGPQDKSWLNKLIAFRDRAIRNEYPLLRIRINARLKEAKRKFGNDGSGYLDMLNDCSALSNFWMTLRQLLCQRIGLMEYYAPDEHWILRDLLARFPERIWLPIIAEQYWPTVEHRKSEHVHELMASYLTGPRADFRHLETAAAKPERESDLPDMVKKAVLGATFGQHSALATFKNMALGPENLPDIRGATGTWPENRRPSAEFQRSTTV